jgi:hypothetical protein
MSYALRRAAKDKRRSSEVHIAAAVEGCRSGMRRRALIGLLAAALAALGTADAWSAARHKHQPHHRKKAVEAEQHKHSIKKSASEAARLLPP